MTFDTVIIGGGIAGWQAAIQLCRCLRKVAVIDAGGGRSSASKGYRNLLGFPGGVSGAQLREAGREYAIRMGAVSISDEVVSLAQREDGLFEVETRGKQRLQGQTVVLATGIADPFPDIVGLKECLGISVFICPDCDGFESAGKKTAVIGLEKQAVEMAKALSFFTDELLLFHHQDADESPSINGIPGGPASPYPIRRERVVEVEHTGGELTRLVLNSGDTVEVTRAFLAFPGARVQSRLLQPFQVRCNEKGHVLVNPRTKETSHPGIWAIGDVTVHSQQVAIAMGDGVQAAIWIHKRLLSSRPG
ncbi:NAD(P)/FAD-dependent oxidoreductase [Brevibacillus composti]|uniref:NAD(P)/FAD-dependent oxidoreductase n=1 Tax=Brevibacillus composti TaxID=2796470 RepID=A0A7T5EHR7_9BACL|nr:NAD(P)/FAD-dependent oxidoreductase [Brevibacillus composti]QQE72788.1 NAD(P)/FAD-dependent oxidoreductase [Brevibacillus composti]QUO39867.1 NAD(P)/FAD-dependent oxidoreductase [Brevibacillus composti]